MKKDLLNDENFMLQAIKNNSINILIESDLNITGEYTRIELSREIEDFPIKSIAGFKYDDIFPDVYLNQYVIYYICLSLNGRKEGLSLKDFNQFVFLLLELCILELIFKILKELDK